MRLRNTDEGRRILELTIRGSMPREVIYYYEIRYGLPMTAYPMITGPTLQERGPMARRRKVSCRYRPYQAGAQRLHWLRPSRLRWHSDTRTGCTVKRDMLLCMRPNANLSGFGQNPDSRLAGRLRYGLHLREQDSQLTFWTDALPGYVHRRGLSPLSMTISIRSHSRGSLPPPVDRRWGRPGCLIAFLRLNRRFCDTALELPYVGAIHTA